MYPASPIKAFSQGEIIEYAREPLARLSLIDDLIDVTGERTGLNETRTRLRLNAAEWIEVERQEEAAREELRELPVVQERVRRLESFFEDPRIRAHDGWYAERAALDQVAELLHSGRRALEDAPLLFVKPALDEISGTAREGMVRELAILLDEAADAVARSQSAAVAELASIHERFDAGRAAWQADFEAAEREHQALLAELDKDGVGRKTLHDQLTALRERERRLLALEKSVRVEMEPRMQEIQTQREELLTHLGSLRLQIREKRRTKAAELTERLDRKVVIEITPEGDGRAQREQLASIRVGSHLRDPDLDAMVETLHPIRLVKSLLSGDYATPARLSGLDERAFEKLMDTIVERNRLSELFDLQIVEREDVVRIRFEIDSQYRQLEALAHGQKCTVVLMVSMAEGDTPLLVDQPEDALHAPWIEDYIVTSLRSNRDRRQCIFATRSANVLVSADAELIVGMKSTSSKGWIEDTGGLDRFSTRTLVLYHVEGGEEAFLRRHGKYAVR